jgi:RND family efflux transporter MFP subunit
MSVIPTRLFSVLFACAFAGAACGGDSPAAQGPQGAPPPAAVKIVTLEQKPIEQSSEFMATLQSLRTTTVQPEVEGIITQILVKSGDRVRAGTPLIQINQERQVAAVRSAEADRAGTEADVVYWQQQVKRMESLVAAGAISRQEFDQAQNSLRTAEARLAALDAQVRQQRVELEFFRVEAAQEGVIGDIPVRKGDRVSTSTVLTTITSNQGLEAYIEVPIERAPELRVGLPVQLLDTNGKVVATNSISFIAPRVDESTQSVLVKSQLRDSPPSGRVQQFIKARIVWKSQPGVTVPIVAVTRLSGQYFCFVAEQQGGNLVAKQRPIQVGEVLGEDYVVVGGLKAGERVIVTGIQKLGDGAPVKAE